MKTDVVKFMINNNHVTTNCVINATIKSYSLGGMPIVLEKDLLFEDCAEHRGAVYVKGCDPENLREYIVGASKIHEINGMDQDTITRLYPEMQ